MIVISDGAGGFIQHRIGEPFTPNIHVIARALSHLNRYTGHVGAYSVAQHSVMVANALPKKLRLAGLLHDAPEAYLGDMSAPLKRHVPGFGKIERIYHDVIDAHYNVETRHNAVRTADLRALVTEVIHFGMDPADFPPAEPLGCTIKLMTPSEAEFAFLGAFYAYL